ncbi:MAG: LysM peptidoglycan-binding domain-containing protein [Ignavibacteria bacterium]
MNCPVCNKADISLDKPACPECGSDLEGLLYVSRLDESIKKLNKTFLIIIIIASLIIIASIIRLFTLYDSRSEANIQIEKYKNEVSSLKSNADSLNRIIKNLSPQNLQKEVSESSGDFKIYVVKSGDSLWKIAQQYLSDGNKYLKIASDNNLEKPYLLKEGQELKIFVSK